MRVQRLNSGRQQLHFKGIRLLYAMRQPFDTFAYDNDVCMGLYLKQKMGVR